MKKNQASTVLTAKEYNDYINKNKALKISMKFSKDLEAALQEATNEMTEENNILPCARDEGKSHEECEGCGERIKTLYKYNMLLKSLIEGHEKHVMSFLKGLQDMVEQELSDIGVEVVRMDPNQKGRA